MVVFLRKASLTQQPSTFLIATLPFFAREQANAEEDQTFLIDQITLIFKMKQCWFRHGSSFQKKKGITKKVKKWPPLQVQTTFRKQCHVSFLELELCLQEKVPASRLEPKISQWKPETLPLSYPEALKDTGNFEVNCKASIGTVSQTWS